MKLSKVASVEILPENHSTVYDITVLDNSNYMVATTGTPFLVHNCREVLAFNIIGNVIASTRADALRPNIAVHWTPENVKSNAKFTGPAGWTRFTQFLAKHNDRNQMIIDQVIKDLEAGHSIAIPVMYKDHALKLAKEINFQYGEEVCATFMGGGKNSKLRKQIVDDARSGKIRVVIGIRRLIQIGINVPQWTCLYSIMPMNNAPNWEQESYRILTPLPDKRTPLIRMFVDRSFVQAIGCFRSTITTSIGLGHRLMPKSKARVEDMFGSVEALASSAKSKNKSNPKSSSLMSRNF